MPVFPSTTRWEYCSSVPGHVAAVAWPLSLLSNWPVVKNHFAATNIKLFLENSNWPKFEYLSLVTRRMLARDRNSANLSPVASDRIELNNTVTGDSDVKECDYE